MTNVSPAVPVQSHAVKSQKPPRSAAIHDAASRALSFLVKPPKAEDDYKALAKSIVAQLERAFAASSDCANFDEIAPIVANAVGIEDFIIQQTFTRDDTPVARVPSSDAWEHRMEYRQTFRVFIRTDKGFREVEGPNLMACVSQAFCGRKEGDKVLAELPPSLAALEPR